MWPILQPAINYITNKKVIDRLSENLIIKQKQNKIHPVASPPNSMFFNEMDENILNDRWRTNRFPNKTMFLDDMNSGLFYKRRYSPW